MYSDAPIITEPREGTAVEEKREILLRWSWNGLLGADEYFDVKIRPDGQNRSTYVAWVKANAHDLTANLSPGRYYWSVQVIKGYYNNNSGAPEDRVLEAYLSPESEPRLLVVVKHEKRKTATPTRRPDLSDDSSEVTPEATSEATSEATPEATSGAPLESSPDASSGDSSSDPPDSESNDLSGWISTG
jgi:hypothetical protein